MLRDVERLRPGKLQVEARSPDARGGDGDRHRDALMGLKLDGLAHGVGLRDKRAVDVEIELILAGFAFDIVDIDMHLRAIAEVEEARQRAGDHDGIAHDHFGFGAADCLRPARYDALPLKRGRSNDTLLRHWRRRAPPE